VPPVTITSCPPSITNEGVTLHTAKIAPVSSTSSFSSFTDAREEFALLPPPWTLAVLDADADSFDPLTVAVLHDSLLKKDINPSDEAAQTLLVGSKHNKNPFVRLSSLHIKKP
jgi:hypothetical protein